MKVKIAGYILGLVFFVSGIAEYQKLTVLEKLMGTDMYWASVGTMGFGIAFILLAWQRKVKKSDLVETTKHMGY